MFTGLVETRSSVRRTMVHGQGLRVWIATPQGWEARRGDSLCVSGACLSVAEIEGRDLVFDLSEETLQRTWFRNLAPGADVNLERAMRLSDRLDGHLVSGHVDGKGVYATIEESGDGGKRFSIEVEAGFERYLVEKGSVTVDGVSLTVVAPRGRLFDVAAIPITLARTTLGQAQPGGSVNLEADMIGKWVERLLAPSQR